VTRGWLLVLLAACGGPLTTLDWTQAASPTPAPVTSPPALHLEGRALRDDRGATVHLRGLNVCSLEFDATGSTWKLTTDGGSELLDVLADRSRWAATVVRVPLNQEWFLTDDAYVARVEQVVDAAATRGVYAVLEVQWERGVKTDPYFLNILPEPTFGAGNTTEAFWHRAAGRFSNRRNVVFELINEPHDVPFERLHEAFQALVDGLHQRAPGVLVIASGPDWAHSVEAWGRRPLRGDVIYSAHQYLPYDEPSVFAKNFEATAATLPVLIGEFDASGALVDGRPFHEVLVERAEAAGTVGWLPWAIGCGLAVDDDRGSDAGAGLAALLRARR
jgi:hypothetical protein